MNVRTLHRRLGITLALFWLVQAASGVLLVFRWELDAAILSAPEVGIDMDAVGARIESLDRSGAKVASVWSAPAAAGAFDVYYADASGTARVMRVDGSGRVLRDRSARLLAADGAIFDSLASLHEFLFAGVLGRWLIAISGALLLTTLILGIRQVWPQLRGWRRTLLTLPQGPARLRVRAWHRFVGIWGVLPAVLVVVAGLLLASGNLFGPASPAPAPAEAASAAPIIGPAKAIRTALAAHPGSTVSVLQLPADERGWYSVRLHTPDEMRRNWGTTKVLITARGGAVIVDQPAASLGTARGLFDAAYPIHTGQIFGWVSRVAVLFVGVWLIMLVLLGVQSWWRMQNRNLAVIALLAVGASALRSASAADEEIQVYMDDLSAPGQFGVDVHNNYVIEGESVAPYPGAEAPRHVYRLTPEFYYGLTSNLELGLYLLSTHTPDGAAHFDGEKLRLKFIAPHDSQTGLFWGANLEVGRTNRRVSETPWNGQLKGILGYRTGPWTLVLNPNVDAGLSHDGGPATFELDAKVAYDVGAATQVGFETYDELGPVSGFQPLSQNAQTVYLAVDHEIRGYDINAGIGRGLTDAGDRWVFKFIVGTHFGGP